VALWAPAVMMPPPKSPAMLPCRLFMEAFTRPDAALPWAFDEPESPSSSMGLSAAASDGLRIASNPVVVAPVPPPGLEPVGESELKCDKTPAEEVPVFSFTSIQDLADLFPHLVCDNPVEQEPPPADWRHRQLDQKQDFSAELEDLPMATGCMLMDMVDMLEQDDTQPQKRPAVDLQPASDPPAADLQPNRDLEPDEQMKQHKVLLQNLPAASEVILRQMLQQANLRDITELKVRPEGGKALVGFKSKESVSQCIAYFHGSYWGTWVPVSATWVQTVKQPAAKPTSTANSVPQKPLAANSMSADAPAFVPGSADVTPKILATDPRKKHSRPLLQKECKPDQLSSFGSTASRSTASGDAGLLSDGASDGCMSSR